MPAHPRHTDTCVQQLGVPLVPEKQDGPTTSIVVLGILIDTISKSSDSPQRNWISYSVGGTVGKEKSVYMAGTGITD